MNHNPELLRAAEVSRWLGISKPRLWQLVREGRLPAHRLGRSIYFSRRVLERWLEAGGQTTQKN